MEISENSPRAGADSEHTTSFPVGRSSAASERFRLLRPHAKGGLGAVFVALDAELNREVALKQMLDRHAGDPRSRQRFMLEAEITGGLEHPGVVPVYGLGTDGNGCPYYAMRFIRGDTFRDAIAAFHDDASPKAEPGRRSLELRLLLRRFVDICNTVEHAHSRGVLHRDIKPANVIVGNHGETLVVDWGLARAKGWDEALEPDGEHPLRPPSASSSAETLPGSALGTPAYMSPEQAVGDLDRLGPRSDVYSLGATLYCLLTGRVAFEGELDDVLRKVQRGQFATPHQIDPTIDRALDAVCLKAMATRPEDRYGSARELADDIERWMANEPLLAYREPWTRTLARWLNRHRTGVTAVAAAGLVALFGLGGVDIVQAQGRAALAGKNADLTLANNRIIQANAELKAANIRAEAGERKAREAVDTFFTRVSEERLLDVPGLQPLRQELLRLALGYYRDFLHDHAGDASPLKRDEARAWLRLGQINSLVGSNREALDDLERARTHLEGLLDENPDDPELLSLLARDANARGVSREQTGDLNGAVDGYREASELAARAVEHDAGQLAFRENLAHYLRNFGSALNRVGRYADGRDALDRSIRASETLLAEHPENGNGCFELGIALSSLAYLDVAEGRQAEAVDDCQRAVEIFRRLLADRPDDQTVQVYLAHALLQQGTLDRIDRRLDDARAAINEAIDLFTRLAKLNTRVPSYRHDLADAYNMLGDLERDSGRLEALGAAAEKARDLLESVRTEAPSTLDVDNPLSKTYNNLGRSLTGRGRADEARRAFLRAADLLARQDRRDPLALYNMACNLSLAMPPADSPELLRERTALGDRAVSALREAVDGGFHILDALRGDPDLDPLRDRDDFRLLLLDLSFPAEPFAR